MKENSLKIIEEEKKLKGFYALRRLYDIGLKIKRNDLREMRRLKEMISIMERAKKFNKGMFDSDDFDDFETQYDERQAYAFDQADLDLMPLELMNCFQKSFACLFLLESCSMDVYDLFKLFKTTGEQLLAFDVRDDMVTVLSS